MILVNRFTGIEPKAAVRSGFKRSKRRNASRGRFRRNYLRGYVVESHRAITVRHYSNQYIIREPTVRNSRQKNLINPDAGYRSAMQYRVYFGSPLILSWTVQNERTQHNRSLYYSYRVMARITLRSLLTHASTFTRGRFCVSPRVHRIIAKTTRSLD